MKSAYFDTVEYDLLAVAKLKVADLKPEPELYQVKWWDYRLMHPVQATYFFMDAYVKAARAYYRRNRDMDSALYRKPFSGKDPFRVFPVNGKRDPNMKPAVAKALWKARQEADRHGIPYDFYCANAVLFAQEHRWASEPRASQLYSHKAVQTEAQMAWGIEPVSIVDWVKKKWSDHCARQIVHSDLDYYKASKTENTLDQRRHRAFVIGQIKSRSNQKFSLAYALENDLILQTEAAAVFGQKVVTDALRLVDQ